MKKICLIFMVSLCCLLACRKDEESTPELTAGKGGNATLIIAAKHHGKRIDSVTIYIKYNAQDAASTYDDSTRPQYEGGTWSSKFTNLKSGKYYLYGYGWDTTILSAVRGGIPYTIVEEKIVDITVPVTETH